MHHRANPTPTHGGAEGAQERRTLTWSWPVGVFLYNLAAISILFGVGVWFLNGGAESADNALHHVAVRCAWCGALGGIVISLKGIYEHGSGKQQKGWDHSYNLWHLGRPVSGAITGVITLVLLQALNPSSPVTPMIAYAAAFILGTQERRFFEFLFQVGRIIVQVPEEKGTDALRITDVQPRRGRADDVIIVCGTAFASGASITIGGRPLGNVTVSGDGTAAAGVVPDHAPGDVAVAVTNPNGASVSSDGAFTYIA